MSAGTNSDVREAILVSPSHAVDARSISNGSNLPPDNMTPPPSRPRQWGRALIGVVLVLLLIVVLAISALVWAMSSEHGSHWLWQTAVSALDGKLSGEWRSGSVLHGFTVNDVRYVNGATRISFSKFDSRWNLAWRPLHITVDKLHTGKVDLAFAPSPPSNTSTMPASLRLPFGLTLNDVRVAKLTMHAPALVLEDIRMTACSDGTQHTVQLEHLYSPYGEAKGNLQLIGQRPFSLAGNVILQAKADDIPVSLKVDLSGSLDALIIDLTASDEKLNGTAHIAASPFGAVLLSRVKIVLNHFNLRDFAPGAPQTDLSVKADLRPESGAETFRVLGPVLVTNAKPGAIDAGLLPVESLRTQMLLDATHHAWTDIELKLAGCAVLTGSGELRREKVEPLPDVAKVSTPVATYKSWLDAPGALLRTTLADTEATVGGFALTMRDLDLRALYSRLSATKLSGPLDVKLDAQGERIVLDWRDVSRRVLADVGLDMKSTTLHALSLEAGKSRVAATGVLENGDTGSYQAQITLTSFDPAAWYSLYGPQQRSIKTPMSSLTGQFDAKGTLRPTFGIALKFIMQDSVYADLPMSGVGTVTLAGTRLLLSDANLLVAGNKVLLRGNFGAVGDKIVVNVDAPSLDKLGFGLVGRLKLDGQVSGTMEHPVVVATLAADKFVFGAQKIKHLAGKVDVSGGLQGASSDRLNVTLDGHGFSSDVVQLDKLSVALAGTRGVHTLNLKVSGKLREAPLDMTLDAAGTITDTRGKPGWKGTIQLRENRDMPKLRNMSVGQHADRFVEVLRRSGDVTLRGGGANESAKVTLMGIQSLSAEKGGVSTRIYLPEQKASTTVRAVSSLVGTLDADVQIGLSMRDGIPTVPANAPLTGRIAVVIPNLSRFEDLAGAQFSFKGRANLQMLLAGTVAKPNPTGELMADDLFIQIFDTGASVKDGRVRIALTPTEILLRDIAMTGGGGGTACVTGNIRLDTPEPTLGITLVADKLQLFTAPDRQLSLTGTAKAGGSGDAMALNGTFTIDRARFSLLTTSAPKLGEDIVVVRGGAQARAKPPHPKEGTSRIGAQPTSRRSPHINVEVNLGRDFRFVGAGADLLLRGSMRVQRDPFMPMRATGTITVAEGTYEAFDRKLSIDRGQINFVGPLDNPNFYIQAMRRNQEVASGVLVTGTVRQPRVALVSEPHVSDEEKLSWLMFGHGPDGAGLGQRQAIAGAATALLGATGGRRIIKDLGIDEFSIGTSDSGLSDDEQVVKVGKAITSSVSLGYEQSLTSAASIVKITWQVSRSWQLALRTGSLSGLDMLFNRRFD